jgi:hypothetical protein
VNYRDSLPNSPFVGGRGGGTAGGAPNGASQP